MAIDGNTTSTIWQTGLPQAPGQWLTVDLGRNVDMDKMLFDSGAAAASDYPRIWDVYTSYDNVTFTHVASGYGTNRVGLPLQRLAGVCWSTAILRLAGCAVQVPKPLHPRPANARR